MSTREIHGVIYEVVDAKETITLADSFVTNKIGRGNGEGKLYVGQDNIETNSFWDGFVRVRNNCFLLKEDLQSYLTNAAFEFQSPSQPYRNRASFGTKYANLVTTVDRLPNALLNFEVYRSNITPPRVYINSSDDAFKLIRQLGVPNMSYLSILKLKRLSDNEIFFYFRIFIEYNEDALAAHEFSEQQQEENVMLDNTISETERTAVIKARKGQGVFREKLLKQCPCCPITLVDDERLLIASHIKPWSAPGITNLERIDPNNGLALTPTYDKLFDRGFISFTDQKRMVVSPWLSLASQTRLNISDGMLVPNLKLTSKRKVYLAYHRNNVFKK